MSSIQAFNSVMEEFLSELKETFPEEKKISVYLNSFQTMKKANPKKILELFMERAKPMSEFITQKNEQLFTQNEDIIPDVQLSKLWNDDLDDETKHAIWEYLNTLYIIGTTINAIPTNLLNTLENVAEQCASQMSESDMNAGTLPDMGSLLAGMQNMIGKLPDQPKSRPRSGKKSKQNKK